MKIKNLFIISLLSLILVLLFVTGATAMKIGVRTFSDVSAKDKDFEAVNYLVAHEIIQGYPDGTFRPQKEINRAEALKIILVAANADVPETFAKLKFNDVAKTVWYAKYVAKAKELGVIQGYADGTFQPQKNVNLVESLKIIFKVKNIEVDKTVMAENPYSDASKDQWYAKYLQYANDKNLLDADTKNRVFPGRGLTRGKFCQILYRLLYIEQNKLSRFSTPKGAETPSKEQIIQEQSGQKMATTTEQVTQQTSQQSTQQATQQITQQTTQQSIQTTLPKTINVNIQDFAFNQTNVTVKAGTNVIWTNKDSVAHTVTSDTGTVLNSVSLGFNNTYSMTFNTTGVYLYHCAPHPFMRGTVTVIE